MNDTILEIKNLFCGYDDNDVVSDVSFSLEKGETLSLIGPNGCGKSTILRTIAGLLPYSGHININGRELSSLKRSDISTNIALLSQAGAGGEYFSYSVFDTVMLGRYVKMKGSSLSSHSSKDRDYVISCLDKTQITDLKDRAITTLSGGQLQRVLLARAFAQEPEIILLDEPTNHLDLKHQISLVELLSEWTCSGHSVISVFHDLNLSMLISDRSVLIDRGKVVMYGNTKEVCLSSALNEVYGVNVQDYMRSSFDKWN